MPSYRSLRSAKPPKLNLKTAETKQTSNNSGKNVSIMDAEERRILYELAHFEQWKPINNLAKACKLSPKTTRRAIERLIKARIITANHTIRNPKPWQFPHSFNGHNLPAKVFVAAVEILKYPTLSNSEIAAQTGTSTATATRAGQHVQRITQSKRTTRIQNDENANAELSESSKRATAQHNAAEDRRKKAEAAKEEKEKAKRASNYLMHIKKTRAKDNNPGDSEQIRLWNRLLKQRKRGIF